MQKSGEEVLLYLVMTYFSSPLASSFALLAFDTKRKYISLPGPIVKPLYNREERMTML